LAINKTGGTNMEKPRKKLQLTKETIRALDLKRVVGGDNDQGSTGCWPTDDIACPTPGPWTLRCATTWCYTDIFICW
jgi:hypothetical protein